MDLATQWTGFAAITVFILAYALVITEEYTSLRKSKAVILGAGIIWAMIGFRYAQGGMGHEAEEAIESAKQERPVLLSIARQSIRPTLCQRECS